MGGGIPPIPGTLALGVVTGELLGDGLGDLFFLLNPHFFLGPETGDESGDGFDGTLGGCLGAGLGDELGDLLFLGPPHLWLDEGGDDLMGDGLDGGLVFLDPPLLCFPFFFIFSLAANMLPSNALFCGGGRGGPEAAEPPGALGLWFIPTTRPAFGLCFSGDFWSARRGGAFFFVLPFTLDGALPPPLLIAFNNAGSMVTLKNSSAEK